jgi:hypothetical protein
MMISGHVTSDNPGADKVKLVCEGRGEDFRGPGDAGLWATKKVRLRKLKR